MNTFVRFFYEFISIFFDGVTIIFSGFVEGFQKMFKYSAYSKIINTYKDSFKGAEWIYVGISILVLVLVFCSVAFLIYLLVRKLIKIGTAKASKEDLLDEIANLNEKVRKLMQEKDEIMSMKVSQLGLKPNESAKNAIKETPDKGKDKDKDKNKEDDVDVTNSRFPKLTKIDKLYANAKVKNYGNTYTLEEIIDNFKCYSASQLHLYYDASLLRFFFGGLACGKLIILQGISGTGKTSLAYAWGKFVKEDSCVASVEPSWRDKTELLGYFNEFTKKFNETDVLAELYVSGFDDNVHTIILDEMNIARVEYYFAEMLSILEMPTRNEWIIELVTSSWDDDPKKIVEGKLKLPGNLWYIGTINNDDSTFMVTDKVYDRAMPIDINSKIAPFKCREQEAIDINASYLESLFADAVENKKVSKENLDKVVL